MFLKNKNFWLLLLKLSALLFVGAMILVQIPELRYDLGPGEPVPVAGPDELSLGRFPRATFVSVAGKADFERAFVYRRYGLSYTFFNLHPYGLRLVVRTYDPVTEQWRDLERFLGKLRPFRRQPFHYHIRDIYRDRFKAEIPEDAFFLALYDVPGLNGWQVGAVAFASLLWLGMAYAFFGRRGSSPFRKGPT